MFTSIKNAILDRTNRQREELELKTGNAEVYSEEETLTPVNSPVEDEQPPPGLSRSSDSVESGSSGDAGVSVAVNQFWRSVQCEFSCPSGYRWHISSSNVIL